MPQTQSVKNSEEYRVKYWVTNSEGYEQQETRSFYFKNKNSHNQAIKECVNVLAKEGKKIKLIN